MRNHCLSLLEDAKSTADDTAEKIFNERTRDEYNQYNTEVYQKADFFLQDAILKGFAATQNLVDQATSNYEDAKEQMEEALANLQGWTSFFESSKEFLDATRDIWRFFQGADV